MKLEFKMHGFENAQGQVMRDATRIPGAIKRVQAKMALHVAKQIREGVRRGWPEGGDKFKPLAESTKKIKKSSKPLINHGDLLRSINATEVKDGWFIGVHKSVNGPDGKPLWNIAEIHEFGTKPFQIPITPKLRRWWMAMVSKGIFTGPLHALQSVISHPGVPARPFLRPVWAKFEKEAEQMWRTLLQQELR